MNDKVYMVHEINDKIIKKLNTLPDESIITLDDGLFTQFKNRDYLKRFKRVIFFINPSIICKVKQSENFITCREAHAKAFKNNFENYMTLEQIKELNENFEIGSHSFTHKYFKDMKELLDDIEKSIIFFNENNIKIKSFCFPYNQDYNKKHFIFAVKSKFKDLEVFGSSRIPIENIKE